MSLALALPVTEAVLFTAGCAAIHALRRQADGVTLALVGILALLVLLVAIAATPEAYRAAQTDGLVEATGLIQPGI